MRSLVICVLLLVSPSMGRAAGAEDGDASRWLQRLRSGSAIERDRAQRWLGLHLTVGDYPLLAALARSADAETTRRLTVALASEPEHLSLALLLASEEDRVLQGIGNQAFDELAGAWCPDVTQLPVNRRTVDRRLVEKFPQSFSFGGGLQRLELHVDRLDRRGATGLPLVLDPGIADRFVHATQDAGDGLTLLANLGDPLGLTYSGMGDWSGERPGRAAWILVSETSGARSRSGTDRLRSWFQAVQIRSPIAPAAARSIGACGWPAAVTWLDRRWIERGDRNALEGLMAAASRGRASRSMLQTAMRVQLLGLADEALGTVSRQVDLIDQDSDLPEGSPAQRFAERVARALIGSGGMGLGGEELSARWIEGWNELNQEQRWFRLVLLEGQRTGGQRVHEFLSALVAKSQDLPPANRFQALRALTAVPARSRSRASVAGVPALARWALEERKEGELARLFDSLEFMPPRTDLGSGRRGQQLALHLAFLARDVRASAELCRSIAAVGSPRTRQGLIGLLEQARFESGPALVEEVGRLALSGVPESDRPFLRDVLLLSGTVVEPMKDDRFRADMRTGALDIADFERLGAWAGALPGERARNLLVSAAGQPPESVGQREALVQACNRALRRLREASLDDLAWIFRDRVWDAVRAPSSALNLRLGAPRWPNLHPSLVVDLLELDRELPELP